MLSTARTTAVLAVPLAALTFATSAQASPQSRHEAVRRPSTAATTVSMPRHAGSVNYANWAGYSLGVNAPTQAHAVWYVPTATWPGRDGYSNAWVGIGGGTPRTGQLIQAGTEHDSICTAARRGRCTAWRTQYYAWIETFPQRSQERITNLSISPGDAVEITVRWAPSESRGYFTLCNWRTSQCVGTSRVTSAPKSGVQYVVERPTLGNGRLAALANVGTVSFMGADARTATGAFLPKQLPNTRITMTNGRTLAATGPWSAWGDSFSVTYRRPM